MSNFPALMDSATSLEGKTLDGNIFIHSLCSRHEGFSTFLAQDLSASTFYDLKLFHFLDPSDNRIYRKCKESARFYKQWTDTCGIFILLRFPKEPLATEDGLFLPHNKQIIKFACKPPVQKTVQKKESKGSRADTKKRSQRTKRKDGDSTFKQVNSKHHSVRPQIRVEVKEETSLRGPEKSYSQGRPGVLSSTLGSCPPSWKRSTPTPPQSLYGTGLNFPFFRAPKASDPAKQMSSEAHSLYTELPIHASRGARTSTRATMIRLLELKPAFMGQGIMCNMYCTSLQDNPKFTALSYVWREPDDSNLSGYTNSKDKSSPQMYLIHIRGYRVLIMKNLYNALLKLRKPDETITLWVDALCIDQNYEEEKTEQVQEMSKIYSAAQEVVAWLGQRTAHSDTAIDLIKDFSDSSLKGKSTKEIYVDEPGMVDLLKRSYWTRIWVLQELACANRSGRICTLQCGDKSVTLHQFQTFVREMLRRNLSHSLLKSFAQVKSSLSLITQKSPPPFLNVLWDSSGHIATDPLDRIFGIRGVSPEFYRDEIKVKYAISLQQLYAKVMTLLMNKEGRLDILCYFKRFVSDPPSPSPSWLRDFSKRNPGIPPQRYSCDKGKKAVAKIKNGRLRAKGVCIGHVKETRSCDSFALTYLTHQDLLAIRKMAHDAMDLRYPEEDSKNRETRFLEMFAGGKQEAVEQLGRNYREKWQTLWIDDTLSSEAQSKRFHRWCYDEENFNVLFSRVIGRAVFTTGQGLVGLGPRETKVGDLICVIYGSSLPLILRKRDRMTCTGPCDVNSKTEKRDRSYEFIGSSYVDGAMNGEFVPNLKTGEPGKGAPKKGESDEKEWGKEKKFWIR